MVMQFKCPRCGRSNRCDADESCMPPCRECGARMMMAGAVPMVIGAGGYAALTGEEMDEVEPMSNDYANAANLLNSGLDVVRYYEFDAGGRARTIELSKHDNGGSIQAYRATVDDYFRAYSHDVARAVELSKDASGFWKADAKAAEAPEDESRGLREELRQLGVRHVSPGGRRIYVFPDNEDGGYLSEIPTLPGCMSQGETISEAIKNCRDAEMSWVAANEIRQSYASRDNDPFRRTRPPGKAGILREWVEALPARMQGVLISAMRGCDTSRKEGADKHIVRLLRGMIVYSHDENPTSYISYSDWEDATWRHTFADALKEFAGNCDHLPYHYLMHLIHAAGIVGYEFPQEQAGSVWLAFYGEMCRRLHMTGESREAMRKRLAAGEKEFAMAGSYPDYCESGTRDGLFKSFDTARDSARMFAKQRKEYVYVYKDGEDAYSLSFGAPNSNKSGQVVLRFNPDGNTN